MEPVLALGTVRPGLGIEAAKRGLRLVQAGAAIQAILRAGVWFVDDAGSAAGAGADVTRADTGRGEHAVAVPMLHVVRGGDAAVAAAIDAGADDAVAVSASAALIAARLAALARRGAPTFRLGPLEIDLVERRVRRSGHTLDLLPREYRLLLHLAERAGQIVPYGDLRRAVWGLRFHPGTNVVAVHVSRLRAKLDRGFDVPLLVTEKGLGYRLAMPGCGG